MRLARPKRCATALILLRYNSPQLGAVESTKTLGKYFTACGGKGYFHWGGTKCPQYCEEVLTGFFSTLGIGMNLAIFTLNVKIKSRSFGLIL
jgi:hypothetical protein